MPSRTLGYLSFRKSYQWMFFFNEYIKGFCDYSIKILILVQIFLNSVIIFMDVILSFLGMWRRRLRRDCFCWDSTRFILFYHLLWHSNSVWLTFWLFSVSVELPGQRLRNKQNNKVLLINFTNITQLNRWHFYSSFFYYHSFVPNTHSLHVFSSR